MAEDAEDGCLAVDIGHAARAKKGEDSFAIERAQVHGDDLLLCLVADGHGGKAASEYCACHLLRYICDEALHEPDASAESLAAAARRAYRRIHAEVIEQDGSSGCTATVCFLNQTRLEWTCCNAGDCYALLCEPPPSRATGHRSPLEMRAGGKASAPGSLLLLTQDHRIAHSEAERERLQELGGHIAQAADSDGLPGGPLRVWPGGLAVARCIGDNDCAPYVSPEPSSMNKAVSKGATMIVCSDGIWDGLKEDEVAAIACKCATATVAAAKIVEKTFKRRGLHDDMTCIVLMVEPARSLSQSDDSQSSSKSQSSHSQSSPRSSIANPLMRLKVRLGSSPSNSPHSAASSEPDVSSSSGNRSQSAKFMRFSGAGKSSWLTPDPPEPK